jgi:hypothetical protein
MEVAINPWAFCDLVFRDWAIPIGDFVTADSIRPLTIHEIESQTHQIAEWNH